MRADARARGCAVGVARQRAAMMLGAVASHLRTGRGGCEPAPAGSVGATRFEEAPGEPTARGELKLLTDVQMQTFIGQGFLTLSIDELGEDFHASLYEHAQAEFGPKNNGLTGTGGSTERIPELLTMVNSPTVAGALTSLIGPEYAHGHLGVAGCALHVSTNEDQIFHKDTQRAMVTGHRTRAVMVMYYPGAADETMGPTAIAPSSHILARDGLGLSFGVTEEGPEADFDREDWSGLGAGQEEILRDIAPTLFEHKVVVPPSAAGTICIVHEDMVHRATPRLSDDARWRPMFKFSFTRVHEPTSPSWNHDPSSAAGGATGWPGLAAADAAPICESIWRWHLGGAPTPDKAKALVIDADVAALRMAVLSDPRAGDEALRIGAAYSLGACGSASALSALADALCSETNESSRRAGSHGLGSAGDAAVPLLLQVLAAPDHSPLVVGSAVDALGEAAMSPSTAVVQCISAVCVAQHNAITAAGRTATSDQLPEFEAGGMVSHVNDWLQVPIMLPVACRAVAARYLVLAIAQIALGRLADRWANAENAALYRMEILAVLKPWSRNACPRVREEQGRAMFQLCIALAGAAKDTSTSAERIAEEVKMLRGVVEAGAYSEVKAKVVRMPAGAQSLAVLAGIALHAA